MKTTQDLLKALRDHQMQSIKGYRKPDPLLVELCARSDEFPSDTKEGEQGRSHIEWLKSIFDAEDVAEIVEYSMLREKIQRYQSEHQISGIREVKTTIVDRFISYRNHADQLLLLDSDIPLLKEDVFRVAEFFCSIATDFGYQIYKELEDTIYSDSPNNPRSSESEINAFAAIAFEASVYSESYNWVRDVDGGWVSSGVGFCEQTDDLPDLIKLRLTIPFAKDQSNAVYFIAEHPDQSRFPWRSA